MKTKKAKTETATIPENPTPKDTPRLEYKSMQIGITVHYPFEVPAERASLVTEILLAEKARLEKRIKEISEVISASHFDGLKNEPPPA